MNKIKTYSEFLNESKTDSHFFFKTRETVERWMDSITTKGYLGAKYTINDDLTVDVTEMSIKLTKQDLINGRIPVQFNRTLDFYCNEIGLKSLKGCPRIVDGDFHCFENEIKDFEGGPRTVTGDYKGHRNDLVSLKGAPKYIGGDFYITATSLKSLEHSPADVKGSYEIYWSNKLESLEGITPEMKRLEIYESDIKTLKGFPNVKNFKLRHLNNIKTLVDLPRLPLQKDIKEISTHVAKYYSERFTTAIATHAHALEMWARDDWNEAHEFLKDLCQRNIEKYKKLIKANPSLSRVYNPDNVPLMDTIKKVIDIEKGYF